MPFPSNFFSMRKPRLAPDASGQMDSDDYELPSTPDPARYSPAISGMPALAPRWESVGPPNSDMSANLATPQSLDRDRLRQAFDSPPQLQRRDVGIGQRLASQFFGRFTKPIDELNGVQDYRDSLTNYQARTAGLQGAVGMDRQTMSDQRQVGLDDLSRRATESLITSRLDDPAMQRMKDLAADARLKETLTSQEKRSEDSLKASEARQSASQIASDARQDKGIAAASERTDKMIASQNDRYDRPKPLSSKDQMAVKGKLATLKIAKQQLAQIKEKFAGIKGSYSAGPLQGMLPTETGKAFDAAVAPLTQTIIGLTRTPGIGSMSDYESRLAAAPIPSRSSYESVTQQQIQQIEDYINTLDSEYTSMGGQSSPAAPEPSGKKEIHYKIVNGQLVSQ